MNIVFVLDKNYSSYLEVALKSVHYHHHNVNIYIIHDGISRAELTRVGQYLAFTPRKPRQSYLFRCRCNY